MSYTPLLWYDPRLLAITVIAVFTLTFLPSKTVFSGNRTGHLDVKLDNEISIEPENPEFISDHSSEIFLSYQTKLFRFETSTELGLEGLSGEKLLLGVENGNIQAQLELSFSPKKTGLESYGVEGNCRLSPGTAVNIEYESEYTEAMGEDDGELALTLERELADDASIEIESIFAETEKQLQPVPAESKIELTGLNLGYFTFNPELEISETNLEEITLDFEGIPSVLSSTDLTLSGTISLDLTEDFLEFESEVETELGTFYLETLLHLKHESQINSIRPIEVGMTDIIYSGFDLEVSNDFESEKTELTLTKENQKVEVEFGLEVQSEENDRLLCFDQLTGELYWSPEEFLAVTVEAESTAKSLQEITLTSEYDF